MRSARSIAGRFSTRGGARRASRRSYRRQRRGDGAALGERRAAGNSARSRRYLAASGEAASQRPDHRADLCDGLIASRRRRHGNALDGDARARRRHAGRAPSAGRATIPRCAPSCSASTAPAARRSRRKRSGRDAMRAQDGRQAAHRQHGRCRRLGRLLHRRRRRQDRRRAGDADRLDRRGRRQDRWSAACRTSSAPAATALQIGANAGMFSSSRISRPSGKDRLRGIARRCLYRLQEPRRRKAASSTPPRSRRVAKGRVWTGERRAKNRLVDALGGFRTALDLAKQSAGIAASQDVTLKLYPPAKTGIDAIVSRFTRQQRQRCRNGIAAALAGTGACRDAARGTHPRPTRRTHHAAARDALISASPTIRTRHSRGNRSRNGSSRRRGRAPRYCRPGAW